MQKPVAAHEVDLFDLHGPRCLFKEVQEAIVEYCDNPTSRLLLFLLFSLNHLREWIAGGDARLLEAKRNAGQSLLPNEELFFQLWEMEEFQTINALCNRSKHFATKKGGTTSVTSGMTCRSPCNDSLDQTYYRIDGVDSRNIFFPVIRRYYEWFASND